MYQFTPCLAPDWNLERRREPMTKRLSVYEPYADTNDFALFRGVLQALFGDPSTTGSDPLFEYYIEARNEQRSWLLTAYLAAGGPAIGGRPHDPDIAAVTEALRSLILTTPPADIDCYYYDGEYDQTFHFVCQDGVCSCTYTDARYGP